MEQRRRNFREFDDIYRKYGKRFRFPVYLGEEFMETPLDNLELSVRSYNCLWRAGIRNVGNIVNRIDNRTDLLHIRNLGIRSADEIMTALMEYQFSLLSDEGKKKYLARIDELNGKDTDINTSTVIKATRDTLAIQKHADQY